VLLAVRAMAAVLSTDVSAMLKVHQCSDMWHRSQEDAAAPSAIPAIRTAPRDEFLSSKAGRAIPAPASLDEDARFIDEERQR
jgi:hypothetical protein